jgi:alkylation response protein AidB-like acyl-CoA dehydrogenase
VSWRRTVSFPGRVVPLRDSADVAARGRREASTASKILRRTRSILGVTRPYSSLQTGGRNDFSQHEPPTKTCSGALSDTRRTPENPWSVIFTIFEGTSEIQRLVIARNISGLRIE